MAIYRTQNERFILSFTDNKFDLADLPHYPMIQPHLVRSLIDELGHDDAIAVVEEVMEKVSARKGRMRDPLKIHEQGQYLEWLQTIANKIAHIKTARETHQPMERETLRSLIQGVWGCQKTRGEIQHRNFD